MAKISEDPDMPLDTEVLDTIIKRFISKAALEDIVKDVSSQVLELHNVNPGMIVEWCSRINEVVVSLLKALHEEVVCYGMTKAQYPHILTLFLQSVLLSTRVQSVGDYGVALLQHLERNQKTIQECIDVTEILEVEKHRKPDRTT